MSNFSFLEASYAHRNRGNQLPAGSGSHGRGNGRRFPADLFRAWGGLYHHGADLLQSTLLSRQKNLLPADPIPRRASCRRADLRQRPHLHGRGRPDRHGVQRGGYSGHQHGLSHGENRQQRRRRGPDERPGKGRPYCGSGGESAARHPGYRQIPPGLGSGTLQLRGICPDAGAGRRFRRGRPRPHPRAGLRRHRRLELHPGREGSRLHPRHRQRRHLEAGGRAAHPSPHRGGHGHDRPGLLRQSLDLPAGAGRSGREAAPPAAAAGGAVRNRRAADPYGRRL